MRALLLLLCLCFVLYAQNDPRGKSNPAIMYGIDGGMLMTFSDYKTAGTGMIGRALIEGYFPHKNNLSFGWRVSYGYGHAAGKDNRYDIPEFKNNFTSISAMLLAARKEGGFMPYVGAGILFSSGKTKDNNGNEIEAAKDWGSNIIGEAGTRYFLRNNLAISLGVSLYLYNDLLDGRETGNFPDYSVACNIGVMYALSRTFHIDFGNKKQAGAMHEGLSGNAMETQLSRVETAYMDSLLNAYAKLTPEEKKEINKKIGASVIYKAFLGGDDFAGAPADSLLLAQIYEEVTGRPFKGFLKDNKQSAADTSAVEEQSTNILVYDVDAEEAVVYFGSGEGEIDRSEYVKLDRLFDLMKETPKEQWLIEAYVDSIEAVEKCKSLAVERAYLVQNYFVSKGIADSRFEIIVKGENDPVAKNSTEEGRAYNRRVRVTKIK